MTFESALNKITQSRARTFTLPDKILAVEWIPANVRIPGQTESPGPFDLSLFPHAQEVLEALDDIEVEEIILIWSTRNGKTFTTLAAVPFWATQRSKPVGFASSDGKNLKENVDNKLYPMLEATPATADLIPSEHYRNSNEVSIGNVKVVLANARSKNSLANFPAQLVIANEVGLWPINSVQRLRQRLRNFKLSSKAIFEGKPETKGSCTISKLANGPDVQRRVRHVPCPHCGKYQPLRWGWGKPGAGVKWDKEAGRSSEFKASSTAYYECESGCRINSSERASMLRRGVWCPEGQTVDRSGKLVGTPDVPSAKRVAFVRLSALYSLMVPGWGAMVSEWFEVKASKELVREFVTGTLAEEYDPQPKSRTFVEVAERLACSTKIGICPAWSKFAVMAVDCGFNEKRNELQFYWQFQAWGLVEGKVRGHLVDFDFIQGVEEFKETVLNIKFRHESGGTMRPSKTGVDFGDGQTSAKVLTLCAELNEAQKGIKNRNKVIPLKGDSRKDSAPGWYVHGYFDTRKEHELRMLKARGECDFVTVRTHNTQSWREGLVSGIIEPKDKEFLSLPWEMSADPESYQQFLNELTADVKNEKGRWEETGANENGDLLRYGRAMASVHTNHDKNWLRICQAEPLVERSGQHADQTGQRGLQKDQTTEDPFAPCGQRKLGFTLERNVWKWLTS